MKTGGNWDYKRQSQWKLKKKHRYFYKWSNRNKKYFYRNDDVGNVHFGFVGAALFPRFVLCAGAGVYQVISDIKGKKKTQIYKRSFGDDPHDTAMIKYGYSLYKKWGKDYQKKLKKKGVKFERRKVRIKCK